MANRPKLKYEIIAYSSEKQIYHYTLCGRRYVEGYG